MVVVLNKRCEQLIYLVRQKKISKPVVHKTTGFFISSPLLAGEGLGVRSKKLKR